MTSHTQHTSLLTLALGGALVTCLLAWHSCTSEPPAGPRDAPTRASSSPPSAAAGAPQLAAIQRSGVDRGPRQLAMQRALAHRGAPLTRAHATARAEALISWRMALDERIAPCLTHEGPPSLRTVEFMFAFDLAESSETSQRFTVVGVNPEPEIDGELAACLRDCVGMVIDVSSEDDQRPAGYDDFIEWVTLPLP
jgi:hypothetical protein